MQVSTLRPGLLVSLKSSSHGNVSYQKRDIEYENEENVEMKKWETERKIADFDEFARAKTQLSLAYGSIRKVCAHSAFGLLCPEADRDDLDAAIREARRVVDEFNASAELTRIHVNVLVARIAADDVEAVKAINGEVRDLMRDMQEGLKNLDVKVVREAASKAKSIGQMLTPEAEGRVTKAVELAREAAKKIVKAGDEATVEIDTRAIRKINEQRTSFLDTDDALQMQKPKAKVKVVDLSDDDIAFEKSQTQRLKDEKKRQRKLEKEFTPSDPNDIIPNDR